ncbi:hypothetical protein AB0P21_21505 [Kribbella sp. NPDC056861]|uniref:hypothetical protein n=1 Tax=Kribbella sp. NPDC056861 TaxID=3154857 RepID=UPI0034461456
MEDQQPEPPPAANRLGVAGVLRELLDLNTIFDSDRPGRLRWWFVRMVFFGLGSGAGWFIWRLVDAESANDRALWERLATNVYFWVGLIATGIYALHDRRK